MNFSIKIFLINFLRENFIYRPQVFQNSGFRPQVLKISKIDLHTFQSTSHSNNFSIENKSNTRVFKSQIITMTTLNRMTLSSVTTVYCLPTFDGNLGDRKRGGFDHKVKIRNVYVGGKTVA